VQFGAAAATLQIDPGAVFVGNVVGNTAVQDQLVLAGSGGTISGFGGQFTGLSVYAEAAGANWTLAGDNTISSGASFSVGGILNITGTAAVDGPASLAAHAVLNDTGTMSFLGALSNQGTLLVAGGVASIATLSAVSGTLELGAAGTLSLLNAAPTGQLVDFLPSGGLLDLAAPAGFAGAISGFGAGDTIDLLSTSATGFGYAGGVLSVMNGGSTVATLHFNGSYTMSSFTVGSDGHGGTQIGFS
jgi:hypothetical protein